VVVKLCSTNHEGVEMIEKCDCPQEQMELDIGEDFVDSLTEEESHEFTLFMFRYIESNKEDVKAKFLAEIRHEAV
jgi:hypothetical protein